MDCTSPLLTEVRILLHKRLLVPAELMRRSDRSDVFLLRIFLLRDVHKLV